jgi:hypothetical protein
MKFWKKKIPVVEISRPVNELGLFIQDKKLSELRKACNELVLVCSDQKISNPQYIPFTSALEEVKRTAQRVLHFNELLNEID